MRKLLTCFLFTLLAIAAYGQQILPLQQDTSLLKQQVSLFGNGFYFGNTLRNDFTRTMLFGGYIDDEMKKSSMMHMVSRNRIGSSFSGELEYQNHTINLFGKENWGLVVRGGYESYNALQFSRDAFDLVFNGNANLTNNTANFGNTHLLSLSYQKIGFGVVDKHSKSSIVVNFVNGSSFAKGTIEKGKYTQTPNSDTIGLTLSGNLAYNNQRKNFVNGQGFSFDFDFRVEINWRKGRKAFIQIMAKNMGLLFFNKMTTNYSVDTNYSYSGFHFKQLLSGGSLVSNNFSLADSLNMHPTKKGKPIFLPGYVQIGKIVDRNNPAKVQPFFGLNVFTSVICLPQLYAGVHYQPAKWIGMGAQGSYGGFGEFRGGVYFDFRMKHFALGLATNDIYGLCSKRGYGASAQIRMTWQLN